MAHSMPKKKKERAGGINEYNVSRKIAQVDILHRAVDARGSTTVCINRDVKYDVALIKRASRNYKQLGRRGGSLKLIYS